MPLQPPANVYPCLDWVPMGVAKERPNRLKLSENELKNIIETAKSRAFSARKKLGQTVRGENSNQQQETSTTTDVDNLQQQQTHKINEDDDAIMKEYGLDDYDEENKDDLGGDGNGVEEMSEGDDDDGVQTNNNGSGTRAATLGLAQDIASLTYHSSNTEDPYLASTASTNRDDDEDEEELIIKPTDNLIVAGHISKDESSIEVYVYDNEQKDFFLHHDIIQSDYPCCIKWIGHARNQRKNIAAVGYMNPDIYLWDLDTVDVLEPTEILSGHKDAVIDICWNSQVKNIIASGSADEHVRIWSLDECKSISNIRLHGKVSALEFGIFEQFLLLAGDLDSKVSLIDTRTGTVTDKWKLNGEVEKVRWIPVDYTKFLVSDDQGYIYCFDIRYKNKNGQSLVKFRAHQNSVTGLEFSPKCDDLLVTASADDTIKVWDTKTTFRTKSTTQQTEITEPVLIKEVADLKVGKILSLRICPETLAMVAVGGDNKCNSFKTYDLTKDKEVRDRFMH